MKVAWHIVGKDVVRLRVILVLWAVVLSGGLELTAIQGGLDEVTYFPFYVAAKVMISGMVPLVVFGLVMGLLHDDSVAEIDAFWMTRPISGVDLLAAKGLAWLLFGLVPVFVTLPFWLRHDYGWTQIVLAIQQTLRNHFIVGALALPLAAVSANGSKFVMNVIVSVGGFLVLILLFSLGNSSNDRSSDAALIIQSRAWLAAWLWFATALAVTLNQFLRRRTRQSVAVLCVAVVVGGVIVKGWPWKIRGLGAEPAASIRVNDPQLQQGLPLFPVTVNGEIRQLVVVAEVPLCEGARASHAGVTLTIQTIFLDFTGQLQISFSEATPQLSRRFQDLLPGAAPQKSPAEYYFINNRSDGRAFLVKPIRLPNDLNSATLNFSHSTIATRPGNSWQGSAPPDLAAWLKGAVLVKTISDGIAPTASKTDATQLPL